MKMLECLTVALFFSFSCGIASADENIAGKKDRCLAFLQARPAIGEIEAGLAECKKVFPPELHAILEKAAIKYAEEALHEAQRDAIINASEKDHQGAKAK